MANQPKKYKKFVATAATATLVASAIVPVASAASFTDVTDTNSHKEAISNLVDAGIIKGYPDGTFKPDQFVSRGQVVKLLGRWLETEGYEIPTDWNTKQRFNDLPVTTADKELVQYAALAKDAGAFNGLNGNLNYSQNMARQQMAIVLYRAIKEIKDVDLVKEYKDAKFTSEISDLGGLNTEQREAITALEYAELTKAATLPGKAFKPNDTITRAQFASFLDRTMKLEVTAPAKAAVKAINNTTVEVTFDQEVDDVQALKFEIKDLEVKNAAVKQTNKKVVVLTTAAQTADKEYTVSIGGEEIGKFKGVSAVIPTKVDLVEKSTQGKLGQQVTLKAQVTVAEGASKAGVPVTFFIPGSANGVKAPVTVEAVTNDEGIATYTYTRYAATNDTVTAYATGDRSKFSTGYVFWAVDQTLTITEVTTGDTINNGANKVYKVTYKDPETGKPVSGKTLNVSVKENIDVTVDKLQNVTINGTAVVQTNENNTKAAQIKTDSKGEATFTVTGSNTEVTPVVFDAAAINTAQGNTTVTTYSQKYTVDTLQASAAKVKFSALQAAYTLELSRDGGEVAATGYENGRKYKVIVKNKDGKLAANETVNVAFNEDIDGVIATETKAQFVEVKDGKQIGWHKDSEGKKITVKTDSKGEATFVIGNADGNVNSYATPIAWIDINNPGASDKNLDKGEPFTIAPISYFQAPYLDGASISSYKGEKETDKFKALEKATIKTQLVNQSGKELKGSKAYVQKVSYTVLNTGANNIKVSDENGNVQVIAPNRSYTTTYNAVKVSDDTYTIKDFVVETEKDQSTSAKVTATGVARHDGKDFAFTAKETTINFTSTSEVTNLYTGKINSFNTDKKQIIFADQAGKDMDAIKYAGESDKKYAYKNVNGAPLSEDQFIKILQDAKGSVTATYELKDKDVTFYLLTLADSGNKPVDTEAASDAADKDLKAAKDKAAAVKEADYTADSYTAFKNALTEANKLAEGTTAEKDAKAKAITAAIELLKLKADADADTALKAAKDKAAALVEADYTTESYKAVTDAGKLAEGTTAEKDTKAKAIEAAIKALVEMKKADVPTATATLAGTELTITFSSNVTVEAGSKLTIGGQEGTVAAGSNAKELKVSFAAAPATGKDTLTVKTPANATTKEGTFTFEVNFDSTAAADKQWTVTSK